MRTKYRSQRLPGQARILQSCKTGDLFSLPCACWLGSKPAFEYNSGDYAFWRSDDGRIMAVRVVL